MCSWEMESACVLGGREREREGVCAYVEMVWISLCVCARAHVERERSGEGCELIEERKRRGGL